MTKESLPYRGRVSKAHIMKHAKEWKCPYCGQKDTSDVTTGLEHVIACPKRPPKASVEVVAAVVHEHLLEFEEGLKQI